MLKKGEQKTRIMVDRVMRHSPQKDTIRGCLTQVLEGKNLRIVHVWMDFEWTLNRAKLHVRYCALGLKLRRRRKNYYDYIMLAHFC